MIRMRASYDGVIDFDRLMSHGPSCVCRASLPPEFACDDLVHPNADGYRAMGECVDLDLFRPRAPGRQQPSADGFWWFFPFARTGTTRSLLES
jgi:hypothetical protein